MSESIIIKSQVIIKGFFIEGCQVFLSSGCATLSLLRIGAITEGSLGLVDHIRNPNLTPYAISKANNSKYYLRGQMHKRQSAKIVDH